MDCLQTIENIFKRFKTNYFRAPCLVPKMSRFMREHSTRSHILNIIIFERKFRGSIPSHSHSSHSTDNFHIIGGVKSRISTPSFSHLQIPKHSRNPLIGGFVDGNPLVCGFVVENFWNVVVDGNTLISGCRWKYADLWFCRWKYADLWFVDGNTLIYGCRRKYADLWLSMKKR